MLPATATADTPRRLVRLLVVLGALAGLFAMHGLSDHGAGHGGGDSAMAAPAGLQHHAHDVSEQSAPAPASSSHADEHSSMGLMGLCLAILITAVVGLLTRSRSPWFWWATPALARAAAATVVAATNRDRGPPGRFALSIQRC